MKKLINILILACMAFSAMAWAWGTRHTYKITFTDGRVCNGIINQSYIHKNVYRKEENNQATFFFNDDNLYDVNKNTAEKEGVMDLVKKLEHIKTESRFLYGCGDGFIVFKEVETVEQTS